MSNAIPSNADVRAQITGVLEGIDLSWLESDETILIPFGDGDEDSSLAVIINVINHETFLGEMPFVSMSARMVVGVDADADSNLAKAAAWVNGFNLRAVLLRAVMRMEERDGTEYLSISMETELLATDLDPRELLVALSELEIAANGLDDELADALGGITYARLVRELASRVRPPADD